MAYTSKSSPRESGAGRCRRQARREALPQPGRRGTLTPPRYRCCSDDAGRSEDRSDAQRLRHLPAAGQRGADALAVVFCLRGLSLEELDGFPASGRYPRGSEGEQPLAKCCRMGPGKGELRGSHVPQSNSPIGTARAELPVASPAKNWLKSVNV